MKPYFGKCLAFIHKSFDLSDSLELRDNIISALFKLIQRDESN